MCVHGVAILSVHLSVTRDVVVLERNEVLFRQNIFEPERRSGKYNVYHSRNTNSAAFRHIRSGRGPVCYDLFKMSVSVRKIIAIVATSCQISRLKCTKFDFRWSSTHARPRWGSLERSPNPLAAF